MGRLRAVPKEKAPGFIRFQLNNEAPAPSSVERESNLSIKTRQGTEIRISRDMPLKQVARLVRMLEGRGLHGLG